MSELQPGSGGVVRELLVPAENRCRLLEMGLLIGTSVMLVRFAPLGDPIEIKLRGYHLSLRRHEAAQILVEVR